MWGERAGREGEEYVIGQRALTRYLDYQTHLHVVDKMGYKWMEDAECFVGRSHRVELPESMYAAARKRVTTALVWEALAVLCRTRGRPENLGVGKILETNLSNRGYPSG